MYIGRKLEATFFDLFKEINFFFKKFKIYKKNCLISREFVYSNNRFNEILDVEKILLNTL